MDYMSEIASAAVPVLCGNPTIRPDIDSVTAEVESALKNEMGWSRFLDIWRDGSADARQELLVSLLYRRPRIALKLVSTLPGSRFPGLLRQIARRIRNAKGNSQISQYRNLSENELLSVLLVSPQRVLALAEFFAIPIPLSTAEHVLWAAAQKASDTDLYGLRALMTRLARLKQQLESVGSSLDREGSSSAVEAELRLTEASMRRLEQLLARVLIKAADASRSRRIPFFHACRRRRV